MSKTYTKSEIRANLATNPKWTERALVRLFERQTADEQATESTRNHNNRGFQSYDAKLFSSFAKQIMRGYSLSPKQLACCGVRVESMPELKLRLWRGRPAICKYAGQILAIMEEDQKKATA